VVAVVPREGYPIGGRRIFRVTQSGSVLFFVNDEGVDNNSGAFEVLVAVVLLELAETHLDRPPSSIAFGRLADVTDTPQLPEAELQRNSEKVIISCQGPG
jgi:hypothetical protein